MWPNLEEPSVGELLEQVEAPAGWTNSGCRKISSPRLLADCLWAEGSRSGIEEGREAPKLT